MSEFLVTVKTRDRKWHFALTMLSLVNNGFDGDIFVWDDGSVLDHWQLKERVLEDLKKRRLIRDYFRREVGIGFSEISAEICRWFVGSSYVYWLSCDDDLIWEPGELGRAARDYVEYLGGGGVLNLFVNIWATYNDFFIGPLRGVDSVGFACFLTDRETMQRIGNPYEGCGMDTERTIRNFCSSLRRESLPLVVRYFDPYRCQHTGNIDSVIFGRIMSWEGGWAVDPVTRVIIEMRSYSGIRKVLRRNGCLESYVRCLNRLFSKSLLL